MEKVVDEELEFELDRLIKKYWITIFNHSNSLNESLDMLMSLLNELESEWVLNHWDEFTDFVDDIHHYGHTLYPPIPEDIEHEERVKEYWSFYRNNEEEIHHELDRLIKRFDDVQLVNGVERNREYPDSFEIPSEEEKDNVQIGDYVKVSDGNERFWTVVEEFLDNETMYVSIDNVLVSNQPYNLDDYLKIHRNHVNRIMKKNT